MSRPIHPMNAREVIDRIKSHYKGPFSCVCYFAVTDVTYDLDKGCIKTSVVPLSSLSVVRAYDVVKIPNGVFHDGTIVIVYADERAPHAEIVSSITSAIAELKTLADHYRKEI